MMKFSYVLLFFAMQAFAAGSSFTDLSGKWKGECFTGYSSFLEDLEIEQSSRDSFTLTRWGQSRTHQLTSRVSEKIDEQWNEDMDNHLEFARGSESWYWCPSSNETHICQSSNWNRWSEFDEKHPVEWHSSGELWLDDKARLIFREMKSYRDTYGQWRVDDQHYCRFEKQ